MRILSWNGRGAVSKGFFRILNDLLCTHQTILFLMEARVHSSRAQRIINLGGFNGFVPAEARGFSGGIRCFWKIKVMLEILSVNDQSITLAIKRGSYADWAIPRFMLRPFQNTVKNCCATSRRLMSI